MGRLPEQRTGYWVGGKKLPLFGPASEVPSFCPCCCLFCDHKELACVFISITPPAWLASLFPKCGAGSLDLGSIHKFMGFVCHSLLSVPHQLLFFLWPHLESLPSRSRGLPQLYTQRSRTHPSLAMPSPGQGWSWPVQARGCVGVLRGDHS